MVDKQTFNRYLKTRYEEQLNIYDKKSIHNQKWAKIYQVMIIILAAITPVFAAIELKWPTIISSALVIIATGILKYYKFEDHWHNYRTICETLKKEKVLYDSKIGPYEFTLDKTKLFIERVEALISKENILWTHIISKEKDKIIKGGQ